MSLALNRILEELGDKLLVCRVVEKVEYRIERVDLFLAKGRSYRQPDSKNQDEDRG